MRLTRNLVAGGLSALAAMSAIGVGERAASAHDISRVELAAVVSDGAPGARLTPNSTGGRLTPNAAGQHCVVVVGRSSGSTTAAPELYRYCTATSREDAQAHLQSAEAQSALGTRLAAGNLLMTWYSDADYGGSSTDLYGYYGTCDSAGYRLEPDSWWRSNMSSAYGWGNCTWADFVNSGNYTARFQLPVPNLGDKVNDNVKYIQVFRG